MRKFLICMTVCIATATGAIGQDESIVDTSTFDQNVRPQDDLYRYVNGSWLKTAEIPSDKSNYGSFIALADLSQERIKSLIEELGSSNPPAGSDAQKVADLYRSFMNEQAIEAAGIAPIEGELKAIADLKTRDDVIRHFGSTKKLGVPSPIGFFVMADVKNSTQNLPQLMQSGTTLPDRDYYLKDDEKSESARQALKVYVTRLFALAGLEQGPQAAENILAIEKRLADAQWPRVKLRDANARYNKHTMKELAELTPGLNWSVFFEGTGARSFEEINVMTPSFFEELDTIINEVPVEQWVQYLTYKTIDAAAPFLSKDFEQAHFDLHSKELAGVPEQKPRWKRAVETISGAGAGDFGVLGEVVGKLYVERYFKPEAKAKMNRLVENLLTAFDSSIDGLTWMTDETKQQAKKKLKMINTKIGYPDKWRDYSKLQITPGSLAENMRRSVSFEYQRMLDKIGQPVDKDEWGMTPQTVNAYYNPPLNEIVFPAAILQPPFFSMDAPDALNYGGIGAVIGHEISHAFDDQGSRYDGYGNLKNWWTDEDARSFKELTEKLVAQYAQYEPLSGKNVNGNLTLGENIADLSGLEIAHRAFRLSLDGQEPEKVAGWTADQLFFVGWSRVWQRKYRDAEMVRRLLIDPHSPSEFRANGPVTNIDAFYKAFNVKESDRLYKPVSERIKIW